MGSRKLEELYREFDAYEDDDLMEAMEEAYKLGCKEGKRKAMDGGMVGCSRWGRREPVNTAGSRKGVSTDWRTPPAGRSRLPYSMR